MNEPDGACSDEALMEAYAHGTIEAFNTLFERHKSGVYNFILRSTRNASVAEELFQEVFMRIIKAAPSYRPEAKFTTWMYRIARNLCVDHARRSEHREAPMHHTDAGALATARPSQAPDKQWQRSHLRRDLDAAMQTLPAEQREVLLLRHVADLPFAEIAAIVGCAEGTIKSRLRYALGGMHQQLAAYQSEVKRSSAPSSDEPPHAEEGSS